MLIAEVFKQEKKSVRKPYVSNNEEWLNKQLYNPRFGKLHNSFRIS